MDPGLRRRAVEPALTVLPKPESATQTPGRGDGWLLGSLCVASALAAFHWVRFVGSGANLLHFDAKAHLLVARRVLDSLTPGWSQLGAVWLPLPHILNVLPSQNDRLYSTGVFASALGFVAYVLGLAALGRAAARATGDPRAAALAVAVPALNPGWLYLQSTPLTEPLFFGLVCGLGLFLVRWSQEGGDGNLTAAAAFGGLACLVRYEAWPIVTSALALVLLWRPDRPSRGRIAWAFGLGFVGPVAFFGIHSWVATGVAFFAISSDNLTETRGEMGRALGLLAAGVREAFGRPLAVAALLCSLWIAASRVRRRHPRGGVDSGVRVAAACLTAATVTFTAYLAGHPVKARYALLLAPAVALLLASATAHRRALQAVGLALAALQSPAIPHPLPVLVEATRDRADVAARRPVVEALRREYRGGRILASMGSLAPVLFELGLPLREVVHEGNGNWWTYAVVDPEREVAWIIIVEGDILDRVRQVRARFPEGFVPVMEFPRVVVYRRATDLLPRQARREARSTLGVSPVTASASGPIVNYTVPEGRLPQLDARREGRGEKERP